MSIKNLGIRSLLCVIAVAAISAASSAGEEGTLKILLLGDSTTIGSICRKTDPKGPHLEDVIRLLLAAEKDLPPTEVINQGRDGEYIERLLGSGRYDRDIAPIRDVDYVFIRYGINDIARRRDFETNFPLDYVALIKRLRQDHAKATVVPVTITPGMTRDDDGINALIRDVAAAENLPVLDITTRYRAELAHGPNMLNYRRYPLQKIPEKHHEWLKPFLLGNDVVVMDNRLDAHFGGLKGWYSDTHPNLAGYHVIGDETAAFLAKLIREKRK